MPTAPATRCARFPGVGRYRRLCQSIGGARIRYDPPSALRDDEPALRGLMAERLAERGFEVAEAATGEKALEYLDQFAFDVLVTDLRLPGIDGTKVIEAARERYPGIITIVITG